MSIALFKVEGGDKTLRQIAGSMKRRPLVSTTERPDGEAVELRTSASDIMTDGNGNLHAKITDEYLDEYTAPEGALSSVVKARTTEIVFTSNPGHLLIFARRQVAGSIAAKVSRIVFGDGGDPVLACRISPEGIGSFIADHNAQILSCSWKELDIPSLSGASRNGAEIGANPDFQRFDTHGLKNSVRVRLPNILFTS